MECDTIAALATAPGVGAVAMIRISGPHARTIGDACFEPLRAAPALAARMRRGWLRDPQTAERIDDALRADFFAPRSYTGEDVVELHTHGGTGVAALCLSAVLAAGARLAAAGEFTRRAFLNGRMDLAQAEAVADLINAESRLAAKAAATRLEGVLGRALRSLRDELLTCLVEIEAHVDYPDEVPAPDVKKLSACALRQSARVDELLAGSKTAEVLRNGLDCAIAGPPNAGKSSLLNALLERARAIVSDIPGTTRDVVEDSIAIDGVVLRLRDTAGLRVSADPLEAQGMGHAKRAIAEAALVILVIDGSRALGEDEFSALQATRCAARIVFCNKADLGDEGARQLGASQARLLNDDCDARICGSVKWPSTLDEMRSCISRLGWGGMSDPSNALVADARQMAALASAREALQHAAATIAQGLPIDLLCGDFSSAIGAYGELTGECVTAEVVDGIFSRFCVGK